MAVKSFLYVISIRSEHYSGLVWDERPIPSDVPIAPPARVKIGHCKKINSRRSAIAYYAGVTSGMLRIDLKREFPTKREAQRFALTEADIAIIPSLIP